MNDTCLTGILTETESCYDRYWRDMEFAANLIEQQREMERFVNESIIKASGNKKAINEMVIINEAAFGDKIKGFFTKIKNFFKKIFDKLGAAMTGLFAEQKKYMDKYANIITKCKYVASDVEDMKDHFNGVPRIFDAVDNTDAAIIGTNLDKYMNPDKVIGGDGTEIIISQAFPYDDATKIQAIKEFPEQLSLEKIGIESFKAFTAEGYWSKIDLAQETNENDNAPNVNLTFKNYFDGSSDTMAFSVDEIDKNFQTIINVSYAGPSYLKKLQKISDGINKKMDDITKKMEDYYKQQSDKIKQGITVNNTSATSVTKGKSMSDAWKAARQVNDDGPNKGKYEVDGQYYTDETEFKNSQYAKTHYTESYNYLNETPKPSSNSSNGSSGNTQQSKISSKTGEAEIQRASDANKNVNDKQLGKAPDVKDSATQGVTDANKNDVLAKANKLLDIDIYNRKARINADIQISSAIARAIFSSFELTNKDFWWIIQHHVQWYLSNPGAVDNAENKSTAVKSLNMNAGDAKIPLKNNDNK